MVRAILTAMREPSDGMLSAAIRANNEFKWAVELPVSVRATGAWQAMIDHLLSEEA